MFFYMLFGTLPIIGIICPSYAFEEDLAPSLPLHADVLTAMSEAG